MPPFGPHYKEDSSICWECIGLDVTPLCPSDPLTRAPRTFDPDMLSLCVPWSEINNSCATCLRIKALLQPHPSIIPEVDPQSPEPHVRVDFMRPYWAVTGNKIDDFICLNYRLKMLKTSLQVLSFIHSRNWKPKPSIPDLKAMRFLLDQCRKDHATSCGLLSRHRDFPLRMIDCSKRTLHEIPVGAQTPYVCLSYLWGKGSTDAASEDHSLENLPKTIEDALFVANELDIPYLCVDRYCINHRDPVERDFLIKRMDVIYEGAALTIIAATGDGPLDGLPGAQNSPRPCSDQYVFQIEEPPMTLLAIVDPAVEIAYSLWATRGWTFQEMLLSRRRLIFTDSQMYFQCGSEHCIEGLDVDITDKLAACQRPDRYSARFYHQKLADVYPQPIGPNMIWKRLEGYCPRALSFRSDIIAAFEGIYGAFQQQKNAPNHFYGLLLWEDILPDQFNTSLLTFATSLSWYLDYRGSPRPQSEPSIYPSWTWAHSMGNQRVERGQMHLAPTINLIRRHFCDWTVTIETRNGQKIGLGTFLRERLDYRSFYPWIDIEAWAAPGSLVPKANDSDFRIPVFTLYDSLALRLDYDLPHIETEILVIFVGGKELGLASYLLVAPEQDGSGYRRLGLYVTRHRDTQEKGLSGIEFLTLIAPRANWKRQMVRLV